MEVFDVSGRRVRVLMVGVRQETSRHSIVWDGSDDVERSVESGTCLVMLNSGGRTANRKVVLSR